MDLRPEKKLKPRRLNRRTDSLVFNASQFVRKIRNCWRAILGYANFFFRRAVFVRVLIFILIVGWIFSGWPQIWQNPPIPPKIQEAKALTTDLVVTSCDINDLADTTCYNAIIADDGSSDTLATKTEHLDAPFQTLEAASINSATLYYDSLGVMDTNEDWWIYVKDTRDGTTICSVDPAPEYASETTDSFDCSAITAAQLSAGVWLYIAGSDAKGPNYNNIEYIRLYVDYNPPAGALTVDIVDDAGSPVASPSITMDAATFSFNYQTANGTFGVTAEKIRVENTTTNPEWTLTIAASNGSTAFWDGAASDYDFNDPTANAVDGSDADSLGGQMTINASGGTLGGTCSATDITKGSSDSFSETTPVVSSILLLTAGASADTDCYWDLTGVSISQTIPAGQTIGENYSIDMTLTITAL